MPSKEEAFEADEFGDIVRKEVDVNIVTKEILAIYKSQLHGIQVFITGVKPYDNVEIITLPESEVAANDYGDAITCSTGFPLSICDFSSGCSGTPVNTAWLIGKDLFQICIERQGDSMHVIADEDSDYNYNSDVIELSLMYHFDAYKKQHPDGKQVLLTGVDLTEDQKRRKTIIERNKKLAGDDQRPEMSQPAG